MQIALAGETLKLHPLKAMFWPSREILFVSDLHVGKVGHFRRHGIGLPSHARLAEIIHFAELMDAFHPKQVYFLGDLTHSAHNLEWDEFGRFLQTYEDVQFALIQGNHDILSTDQYTRYGIQVYSEHLELGPFLLSHEPLEEPHERLYNLCGHVHPGIRMRGQGRQSLRLPCFYFTSTQGILPAFGDLTGNYILKPKRTDQVFVIVGNEILPISELS